MMLQNKKRRQTRRVTNSGLDFWQVPDADIWCKRMNEVAELVSEGKPNRRDTGGATSKRCGPAS